MMVRVAACSGHFKFPSHIIQWLLPVVFRAVKV